MPMKAFPTAKRMVDQGYYRCWEQCTRLTKRSAGKQQRLMLNPCGWEWEDLSCLCQREERRDLYSANTSYHTWSWQCPAKSGIHQASVE